MKVTIVGYEHSSGTSKRTGKSFDFCVIYYSYARPNTSIVGSVTDRCIVDPSFCAFLESHRSCPFSADLSFDNRGRCLSIS